jgi:exopolyphosphatase/guanosine-5'-triphosphate,3'-diphosphate pyrophosphatase
VTRVAALDCGTNSIRLLVAQSVDGDLRDVRRELRIVRLGQGVDATGRFAEEALGRLFAACEEYAAIIGRHRVDRLRFCATSAARDVENRADFVAGVRDRLGVVPEVISGEEEAGLTYGGATWDSAHSTSDRRTWSWTSAAGRPSSCSGTGTDTSTPRSRSTSGRCG